MASEGFIPPHGNYRELLSYQKGEVIYDITLIHQNNFLLDQLKRRLEKDFLEQGGLRERMTRARTASRNKSHKPHPPHDPRP